MYKQNFPMLNSIWPKLDLGPCFIQVFKCFYGLLIKGVENVILMNMEQYEGILNMYRIYWRY